MANTAIFLLLAGFHLIFLRGLVDTGTNAVLFAANALFIVNGLKIYKNARPAKFDLYLLGYFLLFIFVFILNKSPLLFALFVVLFSALFSSTYLLGFFAIIIFSIIFITPYWMQVSLIAGLYYATCLAIYKKSRSYFLIAMFTIGFVLIFVTLAPILYFSFQVTPQTLINAFQNAEFKTAMLNSFATATVSTLIILLFGVPFAYVMARVDFPGKKLLDNFIDLPIIIPQAVAGIALLVLLGPKSPVGDFMYKNCKFAITNGYLGIIAAQVFVSSPFLLRSAINSFESIDRRLEDASRTLGASQWSTFLRISLPLAGSGIFNGCILSWARSLSESGSLMIIAYRPMTAGTYLYDEFIQYGLSETQPIAVLFLINCLWAFIALRWLRRQMAK